MCIVSFHKWCNSHVGLVYTYLAGHVEHTGQQGAFRVLTRGYTHWASGRLQEMEVNTTHPACCHVRCVMKLSMKAGLHVWVCLCVHMHVCACVLCAIFTFLFHFLQQRVSKLHSCLLFFIVNPTSFNLKPNIHSAGVTDGEVPVTLLPCLWKAPRKRYDQFA